VPYIIETLRETQGPIIAATDFVKAVPDFIRPWIKQRYVALGTDGFGRSDTREMLRRFFEVDAESIAVAALHALCQDGLIPARDVSEAIRELGIDPEKPDPLRP
jgi:pyruvate dehydrogenase E1 component